jgi:hypothetical protein
MGVIICDYSAGSNMERTKYAHGQHIDQKDLFKVAKEIFNSGLNVMICHQSDKIILFVDIMIFQQR